MTVLMAALIFFGSAFASILGLLVVRRFVDLEKLRSAHEISGYLISVGGTLYAVLLGLIVVDAMSQGQKTTAILQRETNTLADVFMLAGKLAPPERKKIRGFCKDYATRVTAFEFSQMSCGTQCPISRGLALGLTGALLKFDPNTESEKMLYPQMVQEASEFWQDRQARVTEAERGINPLELVALLVGALIMILFTYVFGSENFELQVILTGMIAMLISLNFILLLLFAYPFRGDFSIQPASFNALNALFAQVENSEK